MNSNIDVTPLIKAYWRGEKGRVAWELCKLSKTVELSGQLIRTPLYLEQTLKKSGDDSTSEYVDT